MADYQSYKELDVWKEARKLVSLVYDVTQKLPPAELYGLISQIRRSAISVPSNIAEGCGRGHKKETMHFLFIARGSLFELETQVYLCFDQKFITSTESENIIDQISTCRKLLSGFINYHKAEH